MRNRPAIWRFAASPRAVQMNPLPVLGSLRKLGNALLRKTKPFGHANLLAYQFFQRGRIFQNKCHRRFSPTGFAAKSRVRAPSAKFISPPNFLSVFHFSPAPTSRSIQCPLHPAHQPTAKSAPSPKRSPKKYPAKLPRLRAPASRDPARATPHSAPPP